MNYFLTTHRVAGVTLEAEVMKRFEVHQWPGNIRELKNCLQYMMVLSEQQNLTTMHLPDYLLEEQGVAIDGVKQVSHQMGVTNEEVYILEAIEVFEQQKEACGREKLAVYSKGSAYEMTKYQMRNRLEKLQELGLITLGKGKVGAKLTDKGLTVVNTIKRPL